VTVSVNAANLDPGQYSGQIAVRADTADDSPQFVSVVLNVLPPGSNPGPVVRPTGLIFTEALGGTTAAPQKVTVSNLTSVQGNFSTGKLTGDGSAWFDVSPSTGTITPSQPLDLTVTVSSKGLTAGIRRGVLTLLFQDGSVGTVNILYLIASGGVSNGASSARIGDRLQEAGSCTPTKLLPLVTSLGSQFVVPAGWPNALESRVVDDCGNPHVSGSAVATFSNGDAPLALISLKNGRWTGTWQVRNTQAAAITVNLTATNPALNISGTAVLAGGVQNSVSAPVMSAGGILSAASYAVGSPLALGSIVSIFGSHLANGQASATQLPLPTQLSGALVTIGGKAASLLFAGNGQINAVVPFGLPVNVPSQVIVRLGDSYTLPEPITVAAAQPGIFTKDLSGKGQAIAIRLDGTFAEPATPAHAGDALVFYAAGLGETTPQAVAGQPAPSSPLLTVASPVTLTIGGQPAAILFAGLVPGLASLYQINVTVPAGINDDAAAVVLTVGDQSSPPATIAVR
jgi:uncharacterized protein (TIGR03437 family)